MIPLHIDFITMKSQYFNASSTGKVNPTLDLHLYRVLINSWISFSVATGSDLHDSKRCCVFLKQCENSSLNFLATSDLGGVCGIDMSLKASLSILAVL